MRKSMAIITMLGGVALLFVGLVCLINGAKPTKPTNPKSNDKRIVERDGEFLIEYFFEYPAWHSYSARFKTVEEARTFADQAFSPRKPDRVIESLPY